MEKQTTASVYKIAGYTSLALVLFFLIMKFFNLVTFVELRFVNFFILLLGIRQILAQRKKENSGKPEYLRGMMLGFMTAFTATAIFASFVFLYLSFIDQSLMKYIKNTQPFGNHLSPGSSALILIIEGVASGTILSFALMHLFNKGNNPG